MPASGECVPPRALAAAKIGALPGRPAFAAFRRRTVNARRARRDGEGYLSFAQPDVLHPSRAQYNNVL